MAAANGMTSKKAREAREKHGMGMPTKALARILYKENPLLYKDEEHARKALLYIEGKSGGKKRKAYQKPNFSTQKKDRIIRIASPKATKKKENHSDCRLRVTMY